MKSIVVNKEVCVRSGACAFEAPEVFELDEDGQVTLIDENPPEAVWPAVRQAASVCPASVIEIVGD